MPTPSHEPADPVQATPTINERALGFWRLRRLDAPGLDCRMALNRMPGPGGGYGIFVEACADKALAGAVRWRPDGDQIVIEDAARHVLLRLTPRGEGWTARDPDEAEWRMDLTPG
jgi:Protease inhibitor Inh.